MRDCIQVVYLQDLLVDNELMDQWNVSLDQADQC
jgi:hypothetical protein